jgi:hypothetical protein
MKSPKQVQIYRLMSLLGLLLAFSLPASANVGTLLMLTGMGQLFIGNCIVGIIESYFIARVFKIRYRTALGLIILANYVSMFIGVAVFVLCMAWLYDPILGNTPLYRLPLLLVIMVALTYLLSVLVEWPFFHLVCRNNLKIEAVVSGEADERACSYKNTLRITAFAQAISYLALALFYLIVSGTGFIRNAHVVHGVDFAVNPKFSIYYLADDGNHNRIALDGTPAIRVTEHEVLTALTECAGRYGSDEEQFRRFIDSGGRFGMTWTHYSCKGSDWQISTDFWGTSGLQMDNKRTKESFNLGLELPFITWRSEYATLLPGDQVVYQFGPQIVLFDIKSRRMTFVAKGARPIVAE